VTWTLIKRSIDHQGTQREVVVEIVAKTIHLEDPKRPGIAITD